MPASVCLFSRPSLSTPLEITTRQRVKTPYAAIRLAGSVSAVASRSGPIARRFLIVARHGPVPSHARGLCRGLWTGLWLEYSHIHAAPHTRRLHPSRPRDGPHHPRTASRRGRDRHRSGNPPPCSRRSARACDNVHRDRALPSRLERQRSVAGHPPTTADRQTHRSHAVPTLAGQAQRGRRVERICQCLSRLGVAQPLRRRQHSPTTRLRLQRSAHGPSHQIPAAFWPSASVVTARRSWCRSGPMRATAFSRSACGPAAATRSKGVTRRCVSRSWTT